MAKQPSKKNKGTLRGLDEMLGPRATHAAILDKNPTEETSEAVLRMVPVEQLEPGAFQPRSRLDEEALQSLAESIRTQGVMQPIIVRALRLKQYEIVAGERRWRAAQLADLSEVPVLVCDLPEQQAQAWALIENIQREDLNVVEEARAMQRLVDETGLTHEKLAKTIGRSRASITNTLRLLRLPKGVLAMVEEGALEMGHARALLGAPREYRHLLAKRIEREGLSVRQTERLANAYKTGAINKKHPTPEDPNLSAMARHWSEKLSVDVKIKPLKGGAGRLIIQYDHLEELESILDWFQDTGATKH